MRDRIPTLLYRRLTAKEFQPTHVAEVGVHLPLCSNVYDYILEGARTTLVEPDPHCASAIRKHFAAHRNVTLHAVAVCDFTGQVELVRRGASTYVALLTHTPATVNDRYELAAADKFPVRAHTFDEIDDGSIDLLSIDVEGSEWFVIKNMISRPAVISVETHGSLYRNPHLAEITAWMEANDYVLWYRSTSDSVYVARGVIEIGRRERIERILVSVYLAYKWAAKRAKHAIRRKQSN